MQTKRSFTFTNPRRMLSCMLKELAEKEVEHSHQLQRELIERKKKKIKSMHAATSLQVLQSSLIPTKKSYPPFTTEIPLSKDQPFVTQKVKASALIPDRFYSHEPNIKVGSSSSPKKWSIPEDPVIVSAKFEEFNRIQDEQSGIVKRERLSKILASYGIEARNQKRYNRMKKTYFQKFVADKFNFYQPNAQKMSTLDSTSCLRKSKSRGIEPSQNFTDSKKETIMIPDHQQTVELPGIRRNRSQDRSQDRSRDRSRQVTKLSINKSRLKTMVFQKNMDSQS